MKLSTIKKISVFGLFGMSFLTHFIYNIFPNPLFAIFFPVNESIWEHMKLLSTTILLYGIIEYFLLKHYNIYSFIPYFSSSVSKNISFFKGL